MVSSPRRITSTEGRVWPAQRSATRTAGGVRTHRSAFSRLFTIRDWPRAARACKVRALAVMFSPPRSSHSRATWSCRLACLALFCAGESFVVFGAESAVLFTNGVVPTLRIEAPPEAMRTLRAYHQVWGQPRPERVDVRVTVRDGDRVFTNVAMHLKGSFTFQPIDDKPSLTLNFDKFSAGQRYRGCDKIHLNNSVQDPSYLCEAL